MTDTTFYYTPIITGYINSYEKKKICVTTLVVKNSRSRAADLCACLQLWWIEVDSRKSTSKLWLKFSKEAGSFGLKIVTEPYFSNILFPMLATRIGWIWPTGLARKIEWKLLATMLDLANEFLTWFFFFFFFFFFFLLISFS